MKSRKLLSLAISLAIVMCSLPAFALQSSAAKYHEFEYEVVNSEVTIISCSADASGNIVIPEKILLKPVTSIEEGAFSDCAEITSVSIPKTVNSIGEVIFGGCSALTAVNVDDQNDYYSDIDGVLFDKNATTLIYYPEGKEGAYTVPETVTSIDYYAFLECSNLTELNIGSNVEFIYGNHYCYCYSLAAININPNNIYYSSVDGVLFDKSITTLIACPPAKDGVYTVPDSVTYIEFDSFDSCALLTEVIIPDGIESIEDFTFYGCSSLTGMNLPESIKNIGYCAFSECSALTEIEIPASVLSIGESAFDYCTALSELTLNEGLESIGSSAFSDCPALTSVLIPNSVTYIGDYALGYTFWEEEASQLVISCYYESAGYNYAVENEIPYVLVEPAFPIMTSSSALEIDPTTGTLISFAGGFTVSDVAACFINKDVRVFRDGVQLSDDDTVGTGCEVVIYYESEEVCRYPIIVSGDINGDGAVGVEDARIALRIAVELENIEDYNEYASYAANVYGFGEDTTVEDARAILRLSVHLSDASTCFNASKDEVLAFYKNAANYITDNGSAGYKKRETCKTNEVNLTGEEFLDEILLGMLINIYSDSAPESYNPGSDEAKAEFPACLLTDSAAINSVTVTSFGGALKVKIILNDVTDPKKDDNILSQITNSVLSYEDFEEIITNNPFVESFDKETSHVTYDDFTIEAFMTRDGKFITLKHIANINLTINATINPMFEIGDIKDGVVSLTETNEYYDFLYKSKI